MILPPPIHDIPIERGFFGRVWTLWLQKLVIDVNKGVKVLAQSAAAVSHTGDTSQTTLATVTIPANSMGKNGRIRVTTVWSYTNSANNKSLRVSFGGTNFLSSNVTTTASVQDQRTISNRGVTNSQVGLTSTVGGFSSSAVSPVTASVDTTADVSLIFSGQLANSAETVTLESYLVELIT